MISVFYAIGNPADFRVPRDQCQNVRAHIPVNATLGEIVVEEEINFRGKYYRATFSPSRSLFEFVLWDPINVCLFINHVSQ